MDPPSPVAHGSSPLDQYTEQVENAIYQKRGKDLRDLLSMKSTLARDAMEVYVIDGGSLPAPVGNFTVLPNLIERRFAAASALNASNWVDAYDHIADTLSIFIQILPNLSSWCIPAFLQVCSDARVVAEQADEQLSIGQNKVGKLEDAERILKRGFTAANNDRKALSEGSNQIGAIGVINQLFRVYFRLNNLRLCENLIRAVDSPNFPAFEVFPRSHRISYKYYTGRLHLYEDRYQMAVDDLTYALKTCPKGAIRNQRQVMLFLIPSRVLVGSLPTPRILKRFRLRWFGDVTEAIRVGNLGLYERTMEKNEDLFIQKGLFLVMEKMRALVVRTMLKSVTIIRRSLYPDSSNKVPIPSVVAAFKACDRESDVAHAECVLANLIYNGYIRGYLSHKMNYLVLSRKNPYPKFYEAHEKIHEMDDDDERL